MVKLRGIGSEGEAGSLDERAHEGEGSEAGGGSMEG